MSPVHRPRKHHHHHGPNRTEILSAKFHQSLERLKELEEEIVRIKEGPAPPSVEAQVKPQEEQYFWPKRR